MGYKTSGSIFKSNVQIKPVSKIPRWALHVLRKGSLNMNSLEIIKEKICKHDWQEITNEEIVDEEEDSEPRHHWDEARVCKKCSKKEYYYD